MSPFDDIVCTQSDTLNNENKEHMIALLRFVNIVVA